MSATAATPDTAPADAPAGRSRKLLLIVVVAVLAAAGGAYAVTMRGAEPAAAEAAPTEAPVEEGAVVEVGTVTTNLAGSPGRYARVGVAMVLAADADPAVVEARLALVKDAAIRVIGQQEVATLQTPEGSTALRTALSDEVTELYPDGEVLRVVLTELLVQ